MSLRYLTASQNHGAPAGIVPENQSLPELQQALDGVDVRVGQPNSVYGHEWYLSWLVQTTRVAPSGEGQSQLL